MVVAIGGKRMNTVLRLVKNQKASATAEYGLIAALISLSAIGALQALAANAVTT